MCTKTINSLLNDKVKATILCTDCKREKKKMKQRLSNQRLTSELREQAEKWLEQLTQKKSEFQGWLVETKAITRIDTTYVKIHKENQTIECTPCLKSNDEKYFTFKVRFYSNGKIRISSHNNNNDSEKHRSVITSFLNRKVWSDTESDSADSEPVCTKKKKKSVAGLFDEYGRPISSFTHAKSVLLMLQKFTINLGDVLCVHHHEKGKMRHDPVHVLGFSKSGFYCTWMASNTEFRKKRNMFLSNKLKMPYRSIVGPVGNDFEGDVHKMSEYSVALTKYYGLNDMESDISPIPSDVSLIFFFLRVSVCVCVCFACVCRRKSLI